MNGVLPKLAFSTLKSTKDVITDDNLVELKSLFGDVLVQATELLENCRLTLYQTSDGSRGVYKIGTKKESYTVFDSINFCTCPVFKDVVLRGKQLTCKHILALELSPACNSKLIQIETVTDSQLANFLNEQIN